LKERQILLQEAIGAMNDPPPPLVTSSMERLTRLMEKAEPVLQENLPVDLSERSPFTLESSTVWKEISHARGKTV
jgi:hypothetical protein